MRRKGTVISGDRPRIARASACRTCGEPCGSSRGGSLGPGDPVGESIDPVRREEAGVRGRKPASSAWSWDKYLVDWGLVKLNGRLESAYSSHCLPGLASAGPEVAGVRGWPVRPVLSMSVCLWALIDTTHRSAAPPASKADQHPIGLSALQPASSWERSQQPKPNWAKLMVAGSSENMETCLTQVPLY